VQRAAGSNSFQIVLQLFDARGDAAPVRLQFRFARAARAYAAPQPGQRSSLAGKTGEHVFQLRQFHLETPLGGTRAAREYVEDQLGAIDDLDTGGALEIALLSGGQFMVDDQNAGMERVRQLFQFLHLAVSQQRGGVHHGTDLKYFSCDLGASAGGQFGKLVKRFGGSAGRGAAASFKSRQDCFLGSLLE
jgi:hypothetical protein